MRSVAGGLKRGAGERSGLAGGGAGKESGAFGLPGMGTVTVLPGRCCERSASGSTTSPRGGSNSFWIATFSRTCRPVTAWAASTRLAVKWPLIHSRKKALGTWTSRASPSPLKPRWTSSPNQRPNRSSPSRSATAARSARLQGQVLGCRFRTGISIVCLPRMYQHCPVPARPHPCGHTLACLALTQTAARGTPGESYFSRFLTDRVPRRCTIARRDDGAHQPGTYALWGLYCQSS